MKKIPLNKLGLPILFLALQANCASGNPIQPSLNTITKVGITYSPTAAASPLGMYYCQGHENGLIASIGMVTFNPDGSFVDQAYYYPPSPGAVGTWRFDPSQKKIYFSENIDFNYAEYNPEEDMATLYLKKGIARPHADLGVIQCYKN
jgi:hypothetical protein